MAVYFFDTSALVKYYHQETGHQHVVDLIEHAENDIRISHLSYVEWHSALARQVRTQAISADDFSRLRSRFYSDLKGRKIKTIACSNAHLWQAKRLLCTHALTQSLRTLDALQLAIALHFHRRIPLAAFVCADTAFCPVVEKAGLLVLNPETMS